MIPSSRPKASLKAEIGTLKCLLDKYMTLTQLQIQHQEKEKENLELKKQITGIPPEDNGGASVPLSPAMKLDRENKKKDYEAGREVLRSLVSRMEEIDNQLRRHICEKVIP